MGFWVFGCLLSICIGPAWRAPIGPQHRRPGFPTYHDSAGTPLPGGARRGRLLKHTVATRPVANPNAISFEMKPITADLANSASYDEYLDRMEGRGPLV